MVYLLVPFKCYVNHAVVLAVVFAFEGCWCLGFFFLKAARKLSTNYTSSTILGVLAANTFIWNVTVLVQLLRGLCAARQAKQKRHRNYLDNQDPQQV